MFIFENMLIAGSEEKLQTLIEKVTKENEKKRLIINYKKTKYMVVSKRNSVMGSGRNRKINPGQKFNYLGSIVKDDRKCDTQI